MSVETLRRVVDDHGNFLTVGPSPDFPENVWLRAETPIGIDWFGNISLDLPAEFMRELGETLIKAADDASC